MGRISMGDTWSAKAWRAIGPVFGKILALPFLDELAKGSLSRERFLFYVAQDALYLEDFGRVLAGLAMKLPKPGHGASFLGFASEAMAVEAELHRSYLGDKPDRPAASPTCLLYVSCLHRLLAIAPLETALAAVLPCFWIYKETGDYILSQGQVIGNPYQPWIDTYGGEAYAKSVSSALAIADELASRATEELRAQMTEAFVLCSRLEWMFWDSAWRLEEWPV
jgi:thiaminase/transcriptional activator TenA